MLEVVEEFGRADDMDYEEGMDAVDLVSMEYEDFGFEGIEEDSHHGRKDSLPYLPDFLHTYRH